MKSFTLHEAARYIQGVAPTVPSSESRLMPDVQRTHKELGKAALLYDRTKGERGLRTIVEGTRGRKVYETDLSHYVKTKAEAVR